LFNLSLSSGIFLDTWKINFIRPIHKFFSYLYNISNYQPIALISLIHEVFESIVANKILPILINVIVNDQHEFGRYKNTITNLLNFQRFVFDALSHRSNVDVIYTNFAKALDKINYKVLTIKLKQIGIYGSFISWIISFIEDRQ